MSNPPIPVHVTHGTPFLWNYLDACKLREEYRVCGDLVGCHPRFSRQSVQLSLPLQLMPEEAQLLTENGICELLDGSSAVSETTEADQAKFHRIREQLYQEQVVACKEKRKDELKNMMSTIKEGRKIKRRKLKQETQQKHNAGHSSQQAEDSTDDEELTIDDIPITPLPRKHAMVQLPLQPIFRTQSRKPAQWCYPQTEKSRLKCKVFRKLWEMGYFITTGRKFGGDFLVYPGDPTCFHAQYIAVCLEPNESLTSKDISTYGRLSTKVKKTMLLCSLDSTGDVVITSLQWAAIT